MARLVMLCAALVTLVASDAFAQRATIKKKDGSLVTGEIVGRLVLAETLPRISVVDGKDVTAIDEGGLRLRDGSTVIVAGMPLSSDPKVYEKTKAIDVLRIILPLAAKKSVVPKVDQSLGMNAAMSGLGDGPGVGTAAFPGGRVFFIKETRSEPPPYPLIGELQESAGAISIKPTLTIVTASGSASIPVDSIVSITRK